MSINEIDNDDRRKSFKFDDVIGQVDNQTKETNYGIQGLDSSECQSRRAICDEFGLDIAI